MEQAKGAATVLAAVTAAARLELPIAVTAWLCIAENMPSSSAIRPNDVLRIRGGRTVEVLNTDAEGRLVLADGMVAAGEEHPDALVDVATLTGAIITALGTRYVGSMGDGALVARTQAAAKRAGELVWHLPLPEELRTILASDVADIANVKIGNTAGVGRRRGEKVASGTEKAGSCRRSRNAYAGTQRFTVELRSCCWATWRVCCMLMARRLRWCLHARVLCATHSPKFSGLRDQHCAHRDVESVLLNEGMRLHRRVGTWRLLSGASRSRHCGLQE